MITVIESVEIFKDKYMKIMAEKRGVNRVEYFGSTQESQRWKKGESDLDIYILGDNISVDVKVQGVLLIRNLNYELSLDLDNVPFQHWTPIYIDSTHRRYLKELTEDQLIKQHIRELRSFAKNFTTKGLWPITYSEWWNLVEFANKYTPLPLPPLYPPIPSNLFLKLL